MGRTLAKIFTDNWKKNFYWVVWNMFRIQESSWPLSQFFCAYRKQAHPWIYWLNYGAVPSVFALICHCSVIQLEGDQLNKIVTFNNILEAKKKNKKIMEVTSFFFFYRYKFSFKQQRLNENYKGGQRQKLVLGIWNFSVTAWILDWARCIILYLSARIFFQFCSTPFIRTSSRKCKHQFKCCPVLNKVKLLKTNKQYTACTI